MMNRQAQPDGGPVDPCVKVSGKLLRLYEWLVREGMDQNGNLVMPWNHVDDAVEWAWMDLIDTRSSDLEAHLRMAENPLDRLLVEKAIAIKKRCCG